MRSDSAGDAWLGAGVARFESLLRKSGAAATGNCCYRRERGGSGCADVSIPATATFYAIQGLRS